MKVAFYLYASARDSYGFESLPVPANVLSTAPIGANWHFCTQGQDAFSESAEVISRTKNSVTVKFTEYETDYEAETVSKETKTVTKAVFSLPNCLQTVRYPATVVEG